LYLICCLCVTVKDTVRILTPNAIPSPRLKESIQFAESKRQKRTAFGQGTVDADTDNDREVDSDDSPLDDIDAKHDDTRQSTAFAKVMTHLFRYS